ncbi:hypothetical protein G6F57_023479 [Rhizopus arrhizus]|nr:hypothetical protein G6F57_023479 [Rhizopus arrhizus]
MTLTQPSSRRVGVIGLGAMGAGIAQSLRRAGHDVHVYDIRADAAAAFAAQGGVACATLADMAAARAVWRRRHRRRLARRRRGRDVVYR